MADIKPIGLDASTGQMKQYKSGDSMGDMVNNATLLTVHRLWLNGTRKSNVKEVNTSAVVSGGTAVFNIADSGGTAIFANIYKESANFWIDNASLQYQFGGYSLAGDLKTLTLTVNKLGTVLLGIIQTVSAANGVTVYLQIKGD